MVSMTAEDSKLGRDHLVTSWFILLCHRRGPGCMKVGSFCGRRLYRKSRGREAALRSPGIAPDGLLDSEKEVASAARKSAGQPLASQRFDENVLSEQGCVMCGGMLRDMIGDDALKQPLASIAPRTDKDPKYVEAVDRNPAAKRDLGWFLRRLGCIGDRAFQFPGAVGASMDNRKRREFITGNSGKPGQPLALEVPFTNMFERRLRSTKRIEVRRQKHCLLRELKCQATGRRDQVKMGVFRKAI